MCSESEVSLRCYDCCSSGSSHQTVARRPVLLGLGRLFLLKLNLYDKVGRGGDIHRNVTSVKVWFTFVSVSYFWWEVNKRSRSAVINSKHIWCV